MDSENPPSLRSRLLTGFAGLLGVFVLYLLSIGPVAYVAIRTGIQPKSLRYFYAPTFWLVRYTPLRQPLLRYDMWWTMRAIGDSNHQPLLTPPATPLKPLP